MDTPIDRKYNEQNLKEILPLLEGMEYFVFYGTLLGLVREGDILEKMMISIYLSTVNILQNL